MVELEKFELENGLKIIVHPDQSTPLVALNLLFKVGARDEHSEKTGFAHLFEHLMFGGSNIPDFDQPLQNAGGENNAFTTNDITNYYLTLPKENIETGFWLESDRMLCLDFSQHNLDLQRHVVIEEYKQRYLNQPYGDAWLLMRPLAYTLHPYQWPTIGKDISHIEEAGLDDVKKFFFNHYAPNNAILVIAGNISSKNARRLTRQWFSGIEKRTVPPGNYLQEPKQESERRKTVQRNVPFDAIYKAFHMCRRGDENFYISDIISDILANGKSSRLYQHLVQEQGLFSELNAFLTGNIDPGLFVVAGKLIKGVEMERAEAEIMKELEKLKHDPVPERELNKVKNRIESSLVLEETNILSKAMSLAFHELLGDAANINVEVKKYQCVTGEQIAGVARELFDRTNCSTLCYKAKSG